MTPLSDSEARTVQRFENAEPAPESWGGGLREALAEALLSSLREGNPLYYEDAADECADAVLALPEIAALRAKADAADRVRALADELDDVARDYRHVPSGTHDAGARNAHMAIACHIRRALDGPSPC